MKPTKKLLYPIAFLIIVTAFLVLPVGCANYTASADQPNHDCFATPLGGISERVGFFEFIFDYIEMGIFAFKVSDGDLRVAFNVCKNCYASGRGYFIQVDDTVVCQQCRLYFSLDSIGTAGQPIPIADWDTGDGYLIIPYTAMAENVHWFLNWRR